MVRCHTSPDQSERMWVPINEVYSTLVYVLQEILSHVKPSWTTTHDSKSVFLVRADHVLLFELLSVFWVVIGSCEERVLLSFVSSGILGDSALWLASYFGVIWTI